MRTKPYAHDGKKFLNLTNEDKRPADEEQKEQLWYEFISEHKVQNKYKKLSFGLFIIFSVTVCFYSARFYNLA